MNGPCTLHFQGFFLIDSMPLEYMHYVCSYQCYLVIPVMCFNLFHPQIVEYYIILLFYDRKKQTLYHKSLCLLTFNAKVYLEPLYHRSILSKQIVNAVILLFFMKNRCSHAMQ